MVGGGAVAAAAIAGVGAWALLNPDSAAASNSIAVLPFANLSSDPAQRYFSDGIAEEFGLPPHRYLLTRRIERATALLRDTDRPITDIALQTGWNSLGTFGRTFRDITGQSPGELRERLKTAQHKLDRVPHCYVAAASRPRLNIAVSEKRRREGGGTRASLEQEDMP